MHSFHTAARLFSKYFKLGFSKASAICELRTSRCTLWILKMQRNQRSNCQHTLYHRKSKGIQKKKRRRRRKKERKKKAPFASLTILNPLTLWITKNVGKFLEVGIPDHLTCLLRILYSGQEATVRTGHVTAD